MKVYRNLNDYLPNGKAVVTTGMFDGVHMGHQKIISRLNEIATNSDGESVVITFWPHPRLVVSPNNATELRLLSTIDEKIEILETLEIDHLVIIPFTREFSEFSSEKFIENILIESIGSKTLVLGYDHHFGHNREGGFDYLTKNANRFGITLEEIPRQEIENMTISSTKIREAILGGNVEIANDLLGRNYSFSGVVVKGRQMGRTIGFPTANVYVQKTYKLIPKNGVYASRVLLRNHWYSAIMNIGNRPTVEGIGRTQEVHIFDFDDDIYGETLKVEVLHFIREEQKFDSLDLLKTQIKLDCEIAKNYFI